MVALMVSRQAITKWEADAGIPDIENLKALAALFGVSVDYLVAGDEPVSGAVLIEPVDLRTTRRGGARGCLPSRRGIPMPRRSMSHRTVRRSWWAWLVELVMPAEFLRGIDAVDKYAAHFLVDLRAVSSRRRDGTAWKPELHHRAGRRPGADPLGDDDLAREEDLMRGWTI